MPKGKPLTEEERREIYEARMMGESRQEVARAYGVTTQCVTRIVREQREKENDMATHEMVIAGNKKTGRLVSTCNPHHYEGTCMVAGKAQSKSFTADNSREATRMWNEWCKELTAEKEQPMSKSQATASKPVEKPVVTNPTPQSKADSVYIIWTKGSEPKMFGAYMSMEKALEEIDHLNEIAAFLASDNAFEVEEVKLRN